MSGALARALSVAVLATACSAPDDDKDTPPADDAPTDETTDPTPEDSDTDGVMDTGEPTVETDDSGLPPIDTGEETDIDTDAQVADIQLLRAGVYPLDELLRFEGLVVTGRRFRTTPPTSNAISVQDPQYTTDAAMLVDLKDLPDTSIPDIGDVVTLVGRFYISPPGGGRTAGQSVLIVSPTDPSAQVIVTGTAPLPTPVNLTPGSFTVTATIEPYEMMRVTVAGGLNVTSNVNTVVNEFKVTGASGTPMIVEDFFWDLPAAYPSVAIGASFTSLSGVVHYESVSYELAPTGPGDVAGYVAP